MPQSTESSCGRDPRSQLSHFSIHLVHNKRLVVPRPEQGFTSDRIFPAADAVSFQNKIINQRFMDIFGTQQTYMPQNELIFARGHLAPVGDFVFEKDIRLTSKYINVVAQFASINNGNWKIIENWVRRQLTSRTFDVLKVCTGALHVLQLSDTRGNWKDISLLAPNKNPIPKWMYKIVSHISGAHFVFLTYNNGWANVRPTPLPVCQVVRCPADLHLDVTGKYGYTFCCDPNHFISTNLPRLMGIC